MESTLRIALGVVFLARMAAGAPSAQLEMPAACFDLSYCTVKHPSYPTGQVDQIVRSTNLTFAGKTPDLLQRGDSGLVEERDCDVLTTDDLISEFRDSAGDVRIVVQSETFRQQVSIERCAAPGRVTTPTKHFDNPTFLDQVTMQCEDQLLDMGFLVLTKDWDRLEMVVPKCGIPVRCNCQM